MTTAHISHVKHCSAKPCFCIGRAADARIIRARFYQIPQDTATLVEKDCRMNNSYSTKRSSGWQLNARYFYESSASVDGRHRDM
jgi:hypothetical protein